MASNRAYRILWIGLLALTVGCPLNSSSMDDDVLSFSIVVGEGFGVAEREGDFVTVTNDDVFECRFTTASDVPLGQNAFFAATPNHQLTLTEAVAGLTVEVIAREEFVLWIRNGANNFCNGANEDFITRGSWSAGDYEIFIGSPNSGEAIDYTLRITE